MTKKKQPEYRLIHASSQEHLSIIQDLINKDYVLTQVIPLQNSAYYTLRTKKSMEAAIEAERKKNEFKYNESL